LLASLFIQLVLESHVYLLLPQSPIFDFLRSMFRTY